jgi:hypothetical protein
VVLSATNPTVGSDKVRLHRYICLWGASERKLGKSLKPNQKVKVKVALLYMPQRASQRSLEKSLQPNLSKQKGKRLNQKDSRKNQGKKGWALSLKIGHTIIIRLVQKSPQTSWAIFILRWEVGRPAGGAVCGG